MRSAAVRAKLINDASMVISLHHIVRMFNTTHVQCTCGELVRMDEWTQHIAEIIVDRSEKIETEES